jgi:hypothetical protein
MRSVAISAGHAKNVRGASASPQPPYLDEVNEARRIVQRVFDLLVAANAKVVKFWDDTSTSQSENLDTIVKWHNKQSRDLDVSVHLNAYSKTSKPMGTEVLYVTQSSLASNLSQKLASAQGLPNRGGKYDGDLAFLNGTTKPAILIEVCFVDSSADGTAYRAKFEEACNVIASVIGDVAVGPGPSPEPEPEPEPTPEPEPGDSRVVIDSVIEGDVTIYTNDVLTHGHEGCEHVVRVTVSAIGDTTLVVNGEEFHNKPKPDTGIKPNHTDIEATVFGGASDPNNSAYPPYDALDDAELYVALPVNVGDAAKRDRGVKVWSHGTQISAVAKIRDKGPWMVDDNEYVDGTARPMAETCHDEESPLPRGPNAGMVPSNRAGIDLSPALARALHISGKGVVDWEWANGDEVA